MSLPDFKTNITGIVAISVLLLSYAILFSIIFWDFPSDQKDIYFIKSPDKIWFEGMLYE